MKRTLPLLLLLVAPPLAAFIPFTNNVRIGPVNIPAYNAAVASNGFEYLVAWTESRTGGSGVYASRVEADGSVNGPVARAIDPAGPFLDRETHPHALSLTAGRDGYFLTWLSDAGLMAAITDSYGVVERRVTIPESASATKTLAAWNGNTYLVLSGFATTFSATLLDNNAQVIKTGVPVGDTHGDYRVRTALVADDNGFLVVSTKSFDDHTDLYGRRISSTGTTGDWFLIRSVATGINGLAVTFDGSRDVVAWSDFVGIWSVPVDAHSDVPGTARQWISATMPMSSAIWAFNRLWITAASHYESAYLITVAADGTVSKAVNFDSAYGEPKLAASSARVLSIRTLAKVEFLAGSFVTPDAAGPDFPVAYHQTLQQNGVLSTDGKTLLTAWDELVGADRRIYASIIDTMHPDLTREVEVTRGASDSNPVAAFNGSEYLLVWMRTGIPYKTEVVGRRLSTDGTLLGAEINFGAGSQPRVTSDGTNWLVVWQRSLGGYGCPFDNGGVKLFAGRVAPSGTLLDPDGVVIAPANRFNQSDADITWSGSQYVVAWSEQCVAWHQPTLSSVSGATMTPDLIRIATAMISGQASTAYGTSVGAPKVTATKNRILIAWTASEQTAPGSSYEKLIDYRLFDDSLVMTGGRQRSAVLRSDTNRIHATLIALGQEPSGQFFILGRMVIPTASAYDGLYRWNLDAAGTATNIGLRFAFSTDERLMGTPLLLGSSWWMAESRFLPDAGAYRLYARDFN